MKCSAPIRYFLNSVTAICMAAVFILSGCRETDGNGDGAALPSSTSALRKIGLDDISKKNFQHADSVGRILIERARLNPGDREAAIYGNIIAGQTGLFTEHPFEAYTFLHEAEILAQKYEVDSVLPSVYNGLGLYSMNAEKDYSEALRCFFLGLDAAKRNQNTRLHSLLLANIAATYYLLNDPMGLRYSMDCYYYGKKNNDDYLIYIGSQTAAFMLKLTGDYTQALNYVKEAELVMHRMNMHDEATLYYIYGTVMRGLGDYAEAEALLRESVEASRTYPNTLYTLGYTELADLLAAGHRYSEALDILREADMKSRNGKDNLFREDVLRLLADIYRRTGNTEKAREYTELVNIEAANSLDTKNKQIEQIRAKYDLERTENELNRRKLELTENKTMVSMLLGVLLLALISAGFVILYYRHKSRMYTAIVSQATEWAQEESRLRDTIRRLEETVSQHVDPDILPQPAPEDLPGAEQPEDEEPEEKAMDNAVSEHSVPDERMQLLAARFEALMANPEVYADNLINKDKVARMLDTNRTYISRLVNEYYKMTFTKFINSLRIREAVRRLSDPDCDTPIKALADELGYNSMTTFYTNFQETTGMTPSAFRDRARSMRGK